MKRRSHAIGAAGALILSVFGCFCPSDAGAVTGTNVTTGAGPYYWSTSIFSNGASVVYPTNAGDTAVWMPSGASVSNIVDQNVVLGRLVIWQTGAGAINVFLVRTNACSITFSNDAGPASMLLARNVKDMLGMFIKPDLVLNSDLIVTVPQVNRNATIEGAVSGSGRLSLNWGLAPAEGPDTNVTTYAPNFGYLFMIGTAGDAASAYTGGTDLHGPTNAISSAWKNSFQVQKQDALGTGTTAGRLYMTNAALDLLTYSTTVGGLTGGGAPTGASMIGTSYHTAGDTQTNTLTVHVNNANYTFSGCIMDTNSLPLGVNPATRKIAVVKSGNGTQILSGVCSYIGGTTIKAGVIGIGGGDDRLPTVGRVILGDGASGSGKLMLSDGVTARSQTLAGLTVSGAGTDNRVVGGGSGVSMLTMNVASGTNVYAGFLGGPGGNENQLALGKVGSGTLSLAATNTYGGGTEISAGAVLANGNGALGAGDVTVNTNGLLRLNDMGANDDMVADPASVKLVSGGSSYGRLSLAGGVNETVHYLYFDGVMQPPGTYGSTNAGTVAMFKLADWFDAGGSGVLTVQAGRSQGTVLTVR